jgi:hypothetical protein
VTRCPVCGIARRACGRIACPARGLELAERGERLAARHRNLAGEACPTCRRPLAFVDGQLVCTGAYCTWRQR